MKSISPYVLLCLVTLLLSLACNPQRKAPDLLRHTALTFLYQGHMYHDRADFKNAKIQYIQAAEYAAEIGDAYLQGLIHFHLGDLFVKASWHSEALERLYNNLIS